MKKILINSLKYFNFFKGNTFMPVPPIIPYHHIVSNETVPHISHLYQFKNLEEFECDLKLLTSFYNTYSLEELIQNKDKKSQSFILTFDDGCSEVYHHIAPLLEKYNTKGVFFLNPDFIDNKNMFYKHTVSIIIDHIKSKSITVEANNEIKELLDSIQISKENIEIRLKNIKYKHKSLLEPILNVLDLSIDNYLEKHQPYLTSVQIEELVKRGHYIGAHSMNHPLYSELTTDEQVKQTMQSVDFLVSKFNLQYRIFSFPHVDDGVGKDFFERVLKTENKPLDLIFGNSNLKTEADFKQVIHRIIGENPSFNFRGFLNAHILFNWIQSLFNKNMIVRN